MLPQIIRSLSSGEVVPNHRDIDAGLEQSDGTTVPKDVGRDPSARAANAGRCSEADLDRV